MRTPILLSVLGTLVLLAGTFGNQSQFYENVTEYAADTVDPSFIPRVRTALISEYSIRNGHQRLEVASNNRCPDSIRPCHPSKYRTANGMCNNVRHPSWGAAGVPFLRLIPPNYADGVSKPRESNHMPNGYEVVNALKALKQQAQKHKYVTSLVGVWGEMLLHDLAATLHPSSIHCCSQIHPECYVEFENGSCKEYVRSVPTISEECVFNTREQLNEATGFLDGSALYNEMHLIPYKLENGRVNFEDCKRCKENSGLGTLYSILIKEHNRIATELAIVNKHWSDETLFHEARRILVAEIQHITYNEFLPIVLGEVLVQMPELKLKNQGYFTSYSSNNHAGTINSVASAVLQIFPFMIPDALAVNKSLAKPEDEHQLVKQLLRSPAVSATSNFFNVIYNSQWDQASLLVHIGRDHGLPTYSNWIKLCSKISTSGSLFSSNQTIVPEMIEIIKDKYGDVGEADLIIAGVVETPIKGGIVGPTFACLLAHQFAVLRASDRFWYENDIPPSSFTKGQLQEIRKVTLAGLLCDNSVELDEVQSRAFVQEDPYLNVNIDCKLQPSMDLSAWKDEESLSFISDDILMQAIKTAKSDLSQRRKKEELLWNKNGGVDPKSPIGTAAAFSKANNHALLLANTSHFLELLSEEIANSLQRVRRSRRQAFDGSRDNFLGFTGSDGLPEDFSDGLQSVDVSPFIQPAEFSPDCDLLEDRSPCDPSFPFRSITGRCNNLRSPDLGKSTSTFARLLPAAYENSISRPRLFSLSGESLPSPRLVSTMIHADISNLHNRYSLMLMQFAQFLDHDLTMTPVHRGFFTSIPDCRPCNSPTTVHPECMPIPMPRGDHYYPPINHTTGERMCLPFMRSLPGQQHLGARDQINQNSAFLDASQIYGEHSCMAKDLRSFGGRLNSTRHPVKGKDLLPQSPLHPECKAPSGYCFIAGDGRASEQPALTSIHTLFLRDHNRLASALASINPHWDDELLYQHARKIVTAAAQHITYNEFLPRILGWSAVNLYELKLRSQGYYKGYTPTCNPSIVNEFATAAFRIGHSLLRPHIPRLSPSYQVVEPPILLRNGFFNPDMIYQPGMIDEIIRGLVSTPMENLDQFITGEITNHLFEDKRIPHSGVDLIALNIQRGRDHAIRPYNDYRALCNLKRASSFEDLSREIPNEVIARLKRIYATVDDIDLFPGGMSERPLQGALVGPTFACIIGIQFRQLRKCDRFWYETDDSLLKFTEPQLAQIRKVTLAKILCENLDESGEMQRSVFDQPSNFLNPRVPCHSLPHIDLNAWRDSPEGCQIAGNSVSVGQTVSPSPCTSCICTPEGPQCASLRIPDCGQLLRQYGRDAVISDDVCTAQCGFLAQSIDTDPSLPPRGRALPPAFGLLPPPRRVQQRPRPRGRPPRPPGNGFKLPDFSSFIG